MAAKHKAVIHGGCQAGHGIGWFAAIPNPFFQLTKDPLLDILIGIGISLGIGVVIQKATKT